MEEESSVVEDNGGEVASGAVVSNSTREECASRC